MLGGHVACLRALQGKRQAKGGKLDRQCLGVDPFASSPGAAELSQEYRLVPSKVDFCLVLRTYRRTVKVYKVQKCATNLTCNLLASSAVPRFEQNGAENECV